MADNHESLWNVYPLAVGTPFLGYVTYFEYRQPNSDCNSQSPSALLDSFSTSAGHDGHDDHDYQQDNKTDGNNTANGTQNVGQSTSWSC